MEQVILACQVLSAHNEWCSENKETRKKGKTRMESFAYRYCGGAALISRKNSEAERASDIRGAERHLGNYCERDPILRQEFEGRQHGQ